MKYFINTITALALVFVANAQEIPTENGDYQTDHHADKGSPKGQDHGRLGWPDHRRYVWRADRIPVLWDHDSGVPPNCLV